MSGTEWVSGGGRGRHRKKEGDVSDASSQDTAPVVDGGTRLLHTTSPESRLSLSSTQRNALSHPRARPCPTRALQCCGRGLDCFT